MNELTPVQNFLGDPSAKRSRVKKVKGIAKEHTCIPHGQVQERGEGQGRGMWRWVEVNKGGKREPSRIVSTLNILN